MEFISASFAIQTVPLCSSVVAPADTELKCEATSPSDAQQTNQGRTLHVFDSQIAARFARALFVALGIQMAKFEVHEIFRLPARREIVIAGSVLEGQVSAGMSVQFELQPKLTCSAIIKGVEFIDRVAAHESLVGLVLVEQDEKEALVYSDLCPIGTIVDVSNEA